MKYEILYDAKERRRSGTPFDVILSDIEPGGGGPSIAKFKEKAHAVEFIKKILGGEVVKSK